MERKILQILHEGVNEQCLSDYLSMVLPVILFEFVPSCASGMTLLRLALIMLKIFQADGHAAAPDSKGFWMTSFWRARHKNLSLENPIDQARSEFDAWSQSYDRSLLQRFFFGPSHRLMLQQLAMTDKRILDVGCGTGRWAELVANHLPYSEVWGLDLSEKMLEHAALRAQQYPGRMHFAQGDSQQLPYESEMFDLVTCSHSFHHYPDQLKVVKEMRRVLKPSGRVILVDGCRDTYWGWFIFDGLVTWAEGSVHHCSNGLMQTMFREAGFENITQVTRRYPVPYLMTMGSTPSAKSRTIRLAA